MTLDNNLFAKLEEDVKNILNKPTPISYFIKEDEILSKQIKESRKRDERLSISQEKLYTPFTL